MGNQNAVSSIGYVKDCYIERALHRQRIQALTKLGAKNEDIDRLEEGQIYNKGIILSSSMIKKYFKNLETTFIGQNI